MRATADQYLVHLQALLPAGPAWPREPEAVLTKMLLAQADGLARVHNRTADLIEEADPRTAYELLSDWERVAGLPDPCSAGIATTLQERRAALVTRLTATGGQSVAYFTGLANTLGYDVTIAEFRPFECGQSQCADHLNGGHECRHDWLVTVHGPRITLFRCGESECGDLLGKITRAEDLECLLHRLKPGHTTLHVFYEGD